MTKQTTTTIPTSKKRILTRDELIGIIFALAVVLIIVFFVTGIKAYVESQAALIINASESGRNRIIQTIEEDNSVPYFGVDEYTQEERIYWISLDRICSGGEG